MCSWYRSGNSNTLHCWCWDRNFIANLLFLLLLSLFLLPRRIIAYYGCGPLLRYFGSTVKELALGAVSAACRAYEESAWLLRVRATIFLTKQNISLFVVNFCHSFCFDFHVQRLSSLVVSMTVTSHNIVRTINIINMIILTVLSNEIACIVHISYHDAATSSSIAAITTPYRWDEGFGICA